MPRDLFGDVTHPSISVGNRKWYTVPLSLAAHASIIIAVVFVSLVAQEFVPLPREVVTYVGSVAPPNPPEPPRPVTQTKTLPPSPGPPLDAPNGINRETGIERPKFEDLGPGVAVGVLPGEGTPVIDAPVAPPAPLPKQREPVHIGGNIRAPAKVRDAQPMYPVLAQTARIEGVVILEAVLDEAGRVQNLRVLRSHPMLEQAAVDAVRQWEYTPTLLNGVPVRVVMTVTVMFKLTR